MKSIVLIIPFIGKWPLWFDAYLISIARNPTINWLFITDCKIPEKHPKNAAFISTTLEELNKRINSALNVQVPLTPRKICDIRPAFGKVFEEYIVEFDSWGYCDVDIIWGNIRFFLPNTTLEKYDIISSRKQNTSGHFTIFKNNDLVNSLYKGLPDFNKKLRKQKNQRMDEDGLTEHLHQILNNPSINNLKVKWDEILCNQERSIDSWQEYHLDKWQWNNGGIIDVQTGTEIMYLHFINWKQTMKSCEVSYNENPSQFYISYNGIHFKSHSKMTRILNDIKNVFNGLWIKERRRIRNNKLKNLKKKIYNKILKILAWK